MSDINYLVWARIEDNNPENHLIIHDRLVAIYSNEEAAIEHVEKAQAYYNKIHNMHLVHSGKLPLIDNKYDHDIDSYADIIVYTYSSMLIVDTVADWKISLFKIG